MKRLNTIALFSLFLFACNPETPADLVEYHVPIESNRLLDADTIPAIDLPQSESHILGDKLLISRTLNADDLFSPSLITVIEEFPDSIAAMKRLALLSENDSTIQFLNVNTYHYTDKYANYIVYKHAARNPNAPRLITYPRTYLTDGNVEIYEVRNNNFHQDPSLSPSQISEFYSAYDVSALRDSTIMFIEQKRYYKEARPFCRFLKFNADKKQTNTLTINDYWLHSKIEMPNDQILMCFAEAEFGARFNYSVATARLLVIDNDLNVLNEVQVFYKGAIVTEMLKKGDSYFLGLKFHVNCSSCDLHHCYFQIEMDKNLQEKGIEITALPVELNLPLDTILNNISIHHPKK